MSGDIIPAHPDAPDAAAQIAAIARMLESLPAVCGADEGDQLVTLMGAAITLCARRGRDRDEWFDIAIGSIADGWRKVKRAEIEAAVAREPGGMTVDELTREAQVVRVMDAIQREAGDWFDCEANAVRAVKLATVALSTLCMMLEQPELIEKYQLAAAEELVGSATMGRLLRGLAPRLK